MSKVDVGPVQLYVDNEHVERLKSTSSILAAGSTNPWIPMRRSKQESKWLGLCTSLTEHWASVSERDLFDAMCGQHSSTHVKHGLLKQNTIDRLYRRLMRISLA